MHRAHVERSSNRLRHRSVEAPDPRSDDLSNDQSKCVGAKHGDDRRCAKSPHDQTFQHEAERAYAKRVRYHSEANWQAHAVRKLSDVSPKQHELASREGEAT